MPDVVIWKVVGGKREGGLIVRDGQKLASSQLSERLGYHSLVEQVVLHGERLQYELLSGSGPKSGWVSISQKGKNLLVTYTEKPKRPSPAPENKEVAADRKSKGAQTGIFDFDSLDEAASGDNDQASSDKQAPSPSEPEASPLDQGNGNVASEGGHSDVPPPLGVQPGDTSRTPASGKSAASTRQSASDGEPKAPPVPPPPQSPWTRNSASRKQPAAGYPHSSFGKQPAAGFPLSASGRSMFAGNRVKCSQCNSQIAGEHVTIWGQAYHFKCFTCGQCSRQIDAGATYYPGEDGSRTCDKCIEEFLPTCAKCNKKIKDKTLTAEGQTYHEACFKCDKCKRPITGQFIPEDGRYVCEPCFVKQLPKCGKCRKPVQGDSLTAEGKTFHSECFKCHSCNQQMTMFFPDKGKFYCESCQKNRLPKCARCLQPIEEEFMTVSNKTYHTGCFKCINCKQQLTGNVYPEKNHYQCEKCTRSRTNGVTAKNSHLPRCASCKHPIADAPAKVDGLNYHWECLVCSSCGWEINGTCIRSKKGLICDWCTEDVYPKCAGCFKPIKDDHTTAEGQSYHNRCFRCKVCKKQISGQYYPGEKREILCECCYVEANCPKCAWCKQAIRDNYTTAEGKSYHVDCFACTACGTAITGPYGSVRDHFICQNCLECNVPSCIACKRVFEGEHLVAEGKAYHRKCFLCGKCQRPINGRYVLRDGRCICSQCRTVDPKGSKVTHTPDEWAAARLKLLQQELRELLQSAPRERKKRLRGLQLELHPDKQTPERRKQAQPLFLLVQAEWEATEAEEKGQKTVKRSSSATIPKERDDEDWHHAREAWFAKW